MIHMGSRSLGTGAVSFLTPYLSGSRMMRLHLESIRRFHPGAPILVSKKGGGEDEMRALGSQFAVRYWLEDCSYEKAFGRLLERCETRYACVSDHDTVLLAPIDALLRGLVDDRYDLVGIEERIRVPDRIWTRLWPEAGGWLRFAPGYADATFLLFDCENFLRRWGLKGLASATRPPPGWHWERHYGLCERLARHHYLLPHHAPRYGMGNLLKDAGEPVLWHAWYGSHAARCLGALPGERAPQGPSDSAVRKVVESAERAFIEDYPDLEFDDCTPAWWPECDLVAESARLARMEALSRGEAGRFGHALQRFFGRLRRMNSEGLRAFMGRVNRK